MKNLSTKLLLCFGIGTLVFIVYQVFFGTFILPLGELLERFLIFQMYSFVIGLSNMYLFSVLEVKKSWAKHLKKRLILGVVYSVVLTMFCMFLLSFTIEVLWLDKSWASFLKNQRLSNYFFGLVITLVIVLVFHVIYFYKTLTEKRVKEHQIVAKTESAKFESLKNQIDPHFLFNSLNVLTALIGENPKQAENFTTKLSKVYRYVLEQKDKELIPLTEELNFARTYMELLAMRFENSVEFNIPKSLSNADFKIVPLSLQLLLENAVKHNVVSEKEPLKIDIFEENGVLVIQNNRNSKAHIGKSTKVGLQNIADRYGLLSLKPVEIIKTPQLFKVILPLLTKRNHIMKTTDYESNDYERASRKVEKLKELYHHAASFCIIMPFLVFINFYLTPFFHWFWFALIGWSIGLLFHYLDVTNYSFFLGKNWEERKIKEIMDEENNKPNWE